jgi:hypothetical protein
MKKLLACVVVVLVCVGTSMATETILNDVIFYANYDNNTKDAKTVNGATITASTSGITWQQSEYGKFGGRAGIAGDGSSTMTYSLPFSFSNNAGMVEFWFNTDNSWAGLTLLDMGNENKITWNAGSQYLNARTNSGNVLSTWLGDYPGGWHHVALTWAPDGNWRKGTALYVDGVQKANNPGDFSGVNASYIKLGESYNTTNYDEVHVYNSHFADDLYNVWAVTGNLIEPGYYYQSSIVPEPMTMIFLGLGSLVAIFRKK